MLICKKKEVKFKGFNVQFHFIYVNLLSHHSFKNEFDAASLIVN